MIVYNQVELSSLMKHYKQIYLCGALQIFMLTLRTFCMTQSCEVNLSLSFFKCKSLQINKGQLCLFNSIIIVLYVMTTPPSY